MKKYLYSSLVLLLIDSSSGVISTFAGKGKKFGYWGDGDLATNANFDSPRGVAMDSDGNIYIADSDNDCIRKVDSEGFISTFVGTEHEPDIYEFLANPREVAMDSDIS